MGKYIWIHHQPFLGVYCVYAFGDRHCVDESARFCSDMLRQLHLALCNQLICSSLHYDTKRIKLILFLAFLGYSRCFFFQYDISFLLFVFKV